MYGIIFLQILLNLVRYLQCIRKNYKAGGPIITGRICRRQLCRYCFYSRADFGVFRAAGATRCTDQGKIWHVPNFILIGPGLGVYGPQNWKKLNFTNIIAPKGRFPCTIFTKFTEFMRVLSLHNFAIFGCFIWLNDKIINNLPRWGRFQPNFRRLLAAKLWMAPKQVWGEMMAQTTSIIVQNLMEIERVTEAWEYRVWCFSLFYIFFCI